MNAAEALMWAALLAYLALVILAAALGVLVSLHLEDRAARGRLGGRVYGSRSEHGARLFGSRSVHVGRAGWARR